MKWKPTEQQIAEIKSGGRVTDAAEWDNMTAEDRKIARPDLNPRKRWFEQAHLTSAQRAQISIDITKRLLNI